MPPPHLHIMGIDPGVTTGWALLTVPRKSIYGNEPGRILEWDQGQVNGPEESQTKTLCRMIRGFQGLDFKVGVALVIEDFLIRTDVRGEAVLSPVRIAAMIRYAAHRGECGDSKIVLQQPQLAKTTATDERLRQWGLYVRGEEHARDAMRHAVTALRRAKGSPEFRDSMWAHVI